MYLCSRFVNSQYIFLTQTFLYTINLLNNNFKLVFWVQYHLLNLCFGVVISQGYFVVKKMVWNVFFFNFLVYLQYLFRHFLSYCTLNLNKKWWFNLFCTPIIFKNPLKTGFSIRYILILLQFVLNVFGL